MEHLVVVFLSIAIAALVVALYRISRNIGPLDLEDYARRVGCVYIPVSTSLVESMSDEFSKPVRLKLGAHSHPMLVELTVQTVEPEQK